MGTTLCSPVLSPSVLTVARFPRQTANSGSRKFSEIWSATKRCRKNSHPWDGIASPFGNVTSKAKSVSPPYVPLPTPSTTYFLRTTVLSPILSRKTPQWRTLQRTPLTTILTTKKMNNQPGCSFFILYKTKMFTKIWEALNAYCNFASEIRERHSLIRGDEYRDSTS